MNDRAVAITATALRLRARDQVAAQAAQRKLATDSSTANNASIAYGLTVCGS